MQGDGSQAHRLSDSERFLLVFDSVTSKAAQGRAMTPSVPEKGGSSLGILIPGLKLSRIVTENKGRSTGKYYSWFVHF